MRFIALMPWLFIFALLSTLEAEAAPTSWQAVLQAETSAYQQQPPDSDPDPVAVVRSMAKAFNEGDLEGVVTYFGESFQLTMQPAFPSTSNKTWEASTRDWARKLIDNDFRIELEIIEAEGNRVKTLTTTWQKITRRVGMTPLVGVEEYVVKDGQITSLNWTASDEAWDDFHAFRMKVFIALLSLVILFGGLTWWFLRRRRRKARPSVTYTREA